MALRALSLLWAVTSTPRDLDKYFDDYARYFPDGPKSSCYAVRIGSKTLVASDTSDLRIALGKYVSLEKRRNTIEKMKTRRKKK